MKNPYRARQERIEQLEAELERTRALLADYEHAISWHTTCRSCANLLDQLYIAEQCSIDANHIRRQRTFSEATFGPGRRTKGIVEHIRKELHEILADPTDLLEWVDVVILALDGAWRSGATDQAILDAIKGKQARNEARQWPDWRQVGEDHAIEHVRTDEAA